MVNVLLHQCCEARIDLRCKLRCRAVVRSILKGSIMFAALALLHVPLPQFQLQPENRSGQRPCFLVRLVFLQNKSIFNCTQISNKSVYSESSNQVTFPYFIYLPLQIMNMSSNSGKPPQTTTEIHPREYSNCVV